MEYDITHVFKINILQILNLFVQVNRNIRLILYNYYSLLFAIILIKLHTISLDNDKIMLFKSITIKFMRRYCNRFYFIQLKIIKKIS